ncbi:MAG: cytochrome c-type biogenesis protein CcmH [Enterobacterales bacterium]|jgi:cytochrome c-type biogenesis protein CcmH
MTSSLSIATVMVYPFDDEVKEQRFNHLIQILRCPKCQNNNLAGSNSALAVDLKNIIFEQMMAGKSDDEIISYLKERYGDFISYRPPLKPSTWIIWFGPFVVLLLSGFFIFRFVSSRQNNETVISQSSSESSDLLEQWATEDQSQKDSDK